MFDIDNYFNDFANLDDDTQAKFTQVMRAIDDRWQSALPEDRADNEARLSGALKVLLKDASVSELKVDCDYLANAYNRAKCELEGAQLISDIFPALTHEACDEKESVD